MADYVMVCGEEDGDCIEVSVESDDTVFLPSITSQFPGTTGLKYRNPDTQAWRLIKCVGDSLQAPKEGWQTVAYLCVRPFDKAMGNGEKRKNTQSQEAPQAKRMPFDNIDTSFGNGQGQGPAHTTWSDKPARGGMGGQRGFGPMGNGGGMNGNGMGGGMGGGFDDGMGFDDGFSNGGGMRGGMGPGPMGMRGGMGPGGPMGMRGGMGPGGPMMRGRGGPMGMRGGPMGGPGGFGGPGRGFPQGPGGFTRGGMRGGPMGGRGGRGGFGMEPWGAPGGGMGGRGRGRGGDRRGEEEGMDYRGSAPLCRADHQGPPKKTWSN